MAALFGAPERGSRGGGGGGGVAATITLIARAGNVDDGGPTTELGRLSSKSNHSHSLILLGEHSNDSIMHHLNHLSNITSPPELYSSNNHHGYNSTIADMTTRHIRQAGPFQQQEQLEAFTWLELLLVAVLIGLILVSIVGNCLVCVAIFTDRRLRKLGNAFIVSLAIADLFVSCLVMTFALCNDLMNTWIFGDWFCDLWISFDIMCCTASILNLCAISLDRFIHIKDCLLYNQWMTKRVALGAVLVIWFISALVSIVPINLGWHRPHHFGGSRALHRRHLAAWSMAGDGANDDHLQLESTGTFISNVAENTNDLDEDDDGLYATRGNRKGGGEERIFGKLNYKWPANGPPQSTKEIIKLAQANDLVANSTPAAHQLQHERRPLGAGKGPSSWQRDDHDEQPHRETKSASLGAPSGHSKWAPPGWTEVRTSGADSQAHRKDNHRRPIGEDEYEQDDKFLMNSQVEVTRPPLLSPPTPPTPRQPDDDDDVARNNINIRAPSEATSTSKLSEYIGQLKRPTTGRQQEQQQQQQFNQVELNPTSRQPGSEAHQTDVPLAATQTGETQIKVAEKHQGDLRRRLQQRRRRQTRPSDWPDESSPPGAYRGPPEADKPGPADQPPPQCMLILTPTYAVVSSTISFYIPCLIMLGLYSKLFACARRHVKNIRAMARAPAPLPLPARSSSSTPSVVGSVAARPEAGVGVQSSGGCGGGGDNNHNHNDNDSDKQPANRADEQTGEQHKSASGRTQDDCQRDDKSNQRPQVAWPRRACRTWIKFGRLKGRGKSGGGGDDKDDVAAKKDTKAKDEKANNTTMLMMTPNQQMGAQSEQPANQCKANKADEQEPFLAEGGQDQLTLNSLTADSLSLSRQVTCNSARSITFRLNLAGLTSKHREQQQSSHSLATITMTNQQQQQQQQQQQEKSTQTHKAAITLGIIMGTFLFCWVPFFCLNIIKAFCVDCIPSSMFRFFTWLGYANSALNPIIYGIHNSEFRNAFNRIFFKHLSLKNGRQYLNRRFSYDVRPHHHHHQQRQQHQNNPKNSSTSLTTNQNNNNNNKSRQPQTPTSNQLEGTTSRPLMLEE